MNRLSLSLSVGSTGGNSSRFRNAGYDCERNRNGGKKRSAWRSQITIAHRKLVSFARISIFNTATYSTLKCRPFGSLTMSCWCRKRGVQVCFPAFCRSFCLSFTCGFIQTICTYLAWEPYLASHIAPPHLARRLRPPAQTPDAVGHYIF